MHKGFKKFIAAAAAAVMAAGALSLSACGVDFKTPTGVPEGDVASNGGFVVAKGDYYYFINGIESYTSDNTYGTPVKGALYRIKKSDVAAKQNSAERVIPSLIVAGTYDAGIYIYGDRVYYTTPNDVPDPITGETDKSYMYFMSAKLDGSDIESYFVLNSNTTPYRIVSVGNTVYVMYVESNDLYSYNTSTKEKTLLADNTTSYVFNKDDATDPTVYYTMAVSENQDSDKDAKTFSYNQVYRVKADATEAPYEYKWDMDYIEEELGGQMPYTNLGEIVLDGISSSDGKTQFNHSATASTDPQGHTYTLRSYANGGLYYTDKPAKAADSSVGSNDNGRLFFIDETKLTASWDSVKANTEIGTSIDLVANAVNLSGTATDSALFYRDEEGQHYLYVENSTIFRADVNEKGEHKSEPQAIADDVSGATFVNVDLTTSDTYDYVWFTRSNGSGLSVERAVINGEPNDYKHMPPAGQDNAPFKPAKVLNVEHANSWYQFEIIGTDLFFADADSDIASTSFNYISTVSLANAQGKLMDNKELNEFTDKYNSIMSTDAKVGLLAKLSGDGNSKLSTAIRYYFMTGEATQFDDNIAFAVDNGKSETYLYTEEEKDAFYAFCNGEGFTDSNEKELFKQDDYKADGESYRTYSYFVTQLGETLESDETKKDDYWKTTLSNYTLPAEEEEESGLPAWAWALIGIGIGVVVLGCVAAVIVVVTKKKGTAAPEKVQMAVDTTDDRDVDVYADEPTEEPAPEEEPAEAAETEEEATEEPAEEAAEEPAEEPAPEEAPTEEGPQE